MSNTRYAALLFMLSQVLRKVVGIPIDNSISGNPSIQCDPDSISVLFSTLKPFIGRTFVKGHIQENSCVQTGNRLETHKFTIHFDQCGLRRSREYNGIRVTTTVIISFHPIFLTKVDRAYRLNCFYMESSKLLTQQLEISMMTTQELRRQTQMPICRYEILNGSPKGTLVRYAKVGDSVYHKWTCIAETEDIYCMRVHSCTVNDGQGGEVVEVLDKKGCSVDRYVLLDLEYTADLMAGQEAHVFKFADRPALYFNCQLELTIKDRYRGCANARPVCKGQVRVEPSAQTYEQPAVEDEYYRTAASVYPQDSSRHQSYPTEAGYKSNETAHTPPLSSLPPRGPPPGPPGPPGVNPPPGAEPALPQPVYTADSNYEFYDSTPSEARNFALHIEDISTLPHTEGYGQTTARPESNTATTLLTTPSVYDETIAYKRLIRRRRNSTQFPAQQPFSMTRVPILPTAVHVADVDLPEQSLTVFGIEDGPPPTNQELHSANLEQLFDPNEGSRTCFTTGRLAVLIAAVAATLVIFAVTLVFILRKQRISLHAEFMK